MKRLKQTALCLFVCVLAMTSVIGPQFTRVYAESASWTVGQAIANNSGIASVEGYVVAHTTGTNAYAFTAPFANDFNLVLADSPDERDAAYLLPVQLPASFRAQYGLQTNPQLIGSKIKVTGTLTAYFAVPGLKSPTAIETLSGPGPGTGEPQLVSIADAKQRPGQTVIVEGVVTADNAAVGGGRLSTFVQDETGGINLFGFTPIELHEGDRVRVTGKIEAYKGLTEIVPASAAGVEVLQSGAELPAPVETTIGGIGEPLEGRLVQLNGYVQQVPSSPAGGGYNVSLIDETFQGTTLRVMESALPIGAIQAGKWYRITAIASQYDGYQLLPRKASDLTLLDPQPPAPDAAGEYESTVAAIVDGDTIHLQSPVLGTTKVRFVNIDTAETYHTPKNDLDQNQLDHGNAAKAYLNTLLKPGDTVKLMVGKEATDDYGRLLAQVVRKSDNMNVNLEMVAKGYAATYFLWPIGPDAEFTEYGDAVKAAEAAKLGIWSESNPLLELPFVFRAREQGKGLLRYAGHFATKRFAAPDKWADVPVESRVFFASEQEALSNGYTAMAGNPGDPIHVQLLGMNDFHGKIDVSGTVSGQPGVKFGRADYLAAYMKKHEATNPNTLIVHAGDMVGASSPVSALLQDEPSIAVLEAIGVDVGAPGNHEFDEGTAELLRLTNGGEHPNGTPGYDGMNFPLILANVAYKSNGELLLPPYAIKEIGGVKIGFIGVVTTETPSIVVPTGIADIRFTDEAEAINKFVPELQAQGVEAIVALAHVPGEQDGAGAKGEIEELALAVNDAVDVIFAGHNHQQVNAVVDNKLIVQSGEYGNAFSDVDLVIDPVTMDVIEKSAEIVDVVQDGSVMPDAGVTALITHYQEIVAPKVNEVIGNNGLAMPKGYPAKGIIGDIALGNLIADGMKWSMHSDLALMNGGGVRDNLDAGPITWGELFNIQPFGNTLVRIEVTGAQFIDILNAMISPQYGPDSFIGGAWYTWDESTNKVVRVTLPDGSALDPAQTYSLTVNSFMYGQANEKYKLLGQYGKNATQGPEDIEATVRFIRQAADPIMYEAEGRISSDIVSPVIAAPELLSRFTYEAFDMSAISASDAGIGMKQFEVKLDGKIINPSEPIPAFKLALGNHVVTAEATDKVGNKAEKTMKLQVTMDLTHLDELVRAGAASGAFKDKNVPKLLLHFIEDAQSKKNGQKLVYLQAAYHQTKVREGKGIEADFAKLLMRDLMHVINSFK
ncbi:5'-nucleotidase C-terminal domain-containing protein [Paenibacillus spongiae]|uniref:5'-nucleotidase C-terminal domain-containing protein n=1 Tax=Paenibacillus spongiae TaxID=2909671 RepID=A0ABY5S4K5_9BACL|nr:5'-nucleotidase C-terminal domain-containing protein [Paenibacillus spongiae]UVI28831.1 5'-nucleotidase C-terminal domain-containing protein [Paenibacillus spongiae]